MGGCGCALSSEVVQYVRACARVVSVRGGVNSCVNSCTVLFVTMCVYA